MQPRTLAHDAPIDLQLHTTYSDGNWSAEQLLSYVASQGFALVAITDHDRADTVAEIQRLAAEQQVAVLPAVEMSSTWEGTLLDILCFGINADGNALQAIADTTRRGQLENIREAHAWLQAQGHCAPRIPRIPGESDGEPRHLWDLVTLVQQHGYSTEIGALLKEAGFQWITAELAAIVDAAHRDGAVCLIAHPGRGDGFVCFDVPQLDRLRAAVPIDGLEIDHPSHTPELAELYRTYAQTHNLLVSTGSDSHGPPGAMPVAYRAEISRQLLEQMGIVVDR